MSAPPQRARRRPPEWRPVCGDPAGEIFGGIIGSEGYYYSRRPDGSFVCQKQDGKGVYVGASRYNVRVLPPAGCTCRGFKTHGHCRHLTALREALGFAPAGTKGG